MKSKNKIHIIFSLFIYYLLVFFPYTNFLSYNRIIYLIFFSITFLIYIKKQPNPPNSFFLILFLYISLMILQSLIYNRFSLESFIGQIIFTTYPLIILSLYKRKFIDNFLTIVYIISLVSFLFYFPSYFSNNFFKNIETIAKSLNLDHVHVDYLAYQVNFLIYTWFPKDFSGIIRNAGNFNEAGYFGVYLVTALSLNIIQKKQLINKYNIVFTIAILTTFSTATYIALFFIAFYSILKFTKRRILLVPIAIIGFFNIWASYAFLGEKVFEKYSSEVNNNKVSGRFGATFQNLKEFSENPIFGRGIIAQTRWDDTFGETRLDKPYQNLNSWSDLLVKLGLIGFIIFMSVYVKSLRIYFKRMYGGHYMLLFITLLIVLSAQPILRTTFFWGLLYLKPNNNY